MLAYRPKSMCLDITDLVTVLVTIAWPATVSQINIYRLPCNSPFPTVKAPFIILNRPPSTEIF